MYKADHWWHQTVPPPPRFPRIEDSAKKQKKKISSLSFSEFSVRAWEMLLFCVCTFLPSQYFLPFLANHLQTCAERNDDFAPMAVSKRFHFI
jgi:hypothetical protein